MICYVDIRWMSFVIDAPLNEVVYEIAVCINWWIPFDH